MTDKKVLDLYVSNPITVDPGDYAYGVQYNNGVSVVDGAFKYSQLMFNRYKITPTVVANNLKVALKHEDGTDPSANRPLYFKINNSLRAVTSALSITTAAGTNWCNLGAAEFATLEQDLFVYIGYNATDGVVIGFSRYPYANLYGDFSATSTNEKYCAISTITTAAAGDDYVLIGRCAAILSAGAGYTWTTPTATSANLIHKPVYETRELSWVPQFTNLTVGNGTLNAKYMIVRNTLKQHVDFTFGSTSSVSGGIAHTLPFTRNSNYNSKINPVVPARLLDASAAPPFAGLAVLSTTLTIQAQDASGTYLKAAAISSTVPFTWTTSDEIEHSIEYLI